MSENAFTWIGNIPGFDKLQEQFQNPSHSPPMADFEGLHLSPIPIAHSVLVMVILVTLAYVGTRKIRKDVNAGILPEKKFSLGNLWELAVQSLYNMVHV